MVVSLRNSHRHAGPRVAVYSHEVPALKKVTPHRKQTSRVTALLQGAWVPELDLDNRH